jgi:hypothetical protein
MRIQLCLQTSRRRNGAEVWAPASAGKENKRLGFHLTEICSVRTVLPNPIPALFPGRIERLSRPVEAACHVVLGSLHVVRRGRSAQFLRPAARRGGAAFVGRGIRACLPTRARSVWSGSATQPLRLFARPNAASPSCPRREVMKWPSERPGLAALVDELGATAGRRGRPGAARARSKWRTTRALLREVWRVLAAGGRMLAVVPNRRGLWARMDTTFGHSRLFALADQLSFARDLVHADRMGRGALCAAGRARWFLRSARAWARRLDLGAVRRRAYHGGDQAGLPRNPGAARAGTAGAGARTGWRRLRADSRETASPDPLANGKHQSRCSSSLSPPCAPPPWTSGRGPRWRRRRRCSGASGWLS